MQVMTLRGQHLKILRITRGELIKNNVKVMLFWFIAYFTCSKNCENNVFAFSINISLYNLEIETQ